MPVTDAVRLFWKLVDRPYRRCAVELLRAGFPLVPAAQIAIILPVAVQAGIDHLAINDMISEGGPV